MIPHCDSYTKDTKEECLKCKSEDYVLNSCKSKCVNILDFDYLKNCETDKISCKNNSCTSCQ